MYILKARLDTDVVKPARLGETSRVTDIISAGTLLTVKCLRRFTSGLDIAEIDFNGRVRHICLNDFEILAPLTWEESLNRIETVGVSQVYADESDAKLIGLKDGSILKISSESESCAACGNCQSNRVPSIRIKLPNVEGWH